MKFLPSFIPIFGLMYYIKNINSLSKIYIKSDKALLFLNLGKLLCLKWSGAEGEIFYKFFDCFSERRDLIVLQDVNYFIFF